MGDRVAMDFAFKAGNRFLREKDIRADVKAALRSSSKNGIDGAIYWACDGVEIMGEHECDLVDHLFAYVTDGLDTMLRGEEFTTFFPDQPLRLSVTTKRDSVVVLVGEKRAVAPRDEFLTELHQLCLRFYELMLFLFPSGGDEAYVKALKLMPTRYPLILLVR
jgi:hypothetical protein